MKKKIIVIISVAAILMVAAGSIYGKTSSDRKQGDPDVVGSFAMNRDENLTVVANRDEITDREAFAKQLLQMCRDNSFLFDKVLNRSGICHQLRYECLFLERGY